MSAQKKAALALVLTLALAGFGCQPASPRTAETGKVRIAASFYPLAEFASKVGGEYVTVSTVTPAGAEPHEYEPTPQQIASVYASDLLVFNGVGLDNWAARLAPSLAAEGVTTVEIAPLTGPLLAATKTEQDMAYDPHVWLDPVLAMKAVEAIRDALVAKDPANAAAYRVNAEGYVTALRVLDAEYSAGLASCSMRTAVTSHAAFAYLAKRYGFTQLPVSGLSPEEEPSAGQLAAVAVEAKAKNVKYIFFETLVSPQLAETIAREVGAQTLVFNPLEGLTDREKAAGKDYLSVMRENLANLRIALQCK